MLVVWCLRTMDYLQALAVQGLVCFFFLSPCPHTLKSLLPITIIFSPIMLRCWLEWESPEANQIHCSLVPSLGLRVTKPSGTPGWAAPGSTRLLGAERERGIWTECSSCSAWERRVYLPSQVLLYVNSLHIKALGAVLSPSVLAKG